jgi:hypothetical protein
VVAHPMYVAWLSPIWHFFPHLYRSTTEAGPHTPPASCEAAGRVGAIQCNSSSQWEKTHVRVDLIKLLRCHSETDSSWRESKRVLHRTARRRSNFLGLLWYLHQSSLVSFRYLIFNMKILEAILLLWSGAVNGCIAVWTLSTLLLIKYL